MRRAVNLNIEAASLVGARFWVKGGCDRLRRDTHDRQRVDEVLSVLDVE
jgi:hypothetical protein